MAAAIERQNYWDRYAEEKTFTHPPDMKLLKELLQPDACIIDFGCGYGRLTGALAAQGFTNVRGYDSSAKLVERGQRAGIKNLAHLQSVTHLPDAENTVDCFLLFAVLTCIPGNGDQKFLIEHLYHLLKPGGFIYLSDYYLQDEKTEGSSYGSLHDDSNNYGVFTTTDGGLFRHHQKSYIRELFHQFVISEEKEISVTTMNGSNASAFQLIAGKPNQSTLTLPS